MDNILENFSHSANFWKYNPQFLAVKEFNEFYNTDKSKAKDQSSKIMWGITFFVHPQSVFKNLDDDDKKEIIAGDYIKNKKFNWDSVEDLIETFSLLVLTKAKKSLDAWERKLRERDKFIDDTPYNLDTAEQLDKILKITADLWKQYKAIREDVLSEGEISITKGGSRPSLSDDGRI